MNATAEHTIELAVIGAGPGGYAAAFLAADLGLAVTLIDPNPDPGGVCLYRGCIPSKALLHAARLINEAAAAGEMGISFGDPDIDLEGLRSWKSGIVRKMTQGLGRLVAERKITHVRGTAKFMDNRRLEILTEDGSRREMSCKHAIVATGSRPVRLKGPDPHSPFLLDSRGALELEDVPKRLLVVGGGYIGLELGSVYAALGSRVSVVEMTAGLLPGVDPDLAGVLRKRLDTLFEMIAVNTRAEGFQERDNGLEITLLGADETRTREIYDKVLIAVGRQPATKGLGLENAGIAVDSTGFIKIDASCRTTADNVFAVGDVAGEPMLAHKASHQGRVAVETITGEKAAFDPAAIPAVVFTDPELAWAGFTERQARESGLDIQVARFPWTASGRALAIGRVDGLTKLVVEKKTRRILGVGIVGANAGEMIAEGVLAMEMGANAFDVKMTIHPHPTLTETLQEAAEMVFNTATHFYRPKR